MTLVVKRVHQFTEDYQRMSTPNEWQPPSFFTRNSLVITKATVLGREHVQLHCYSGRIEPATLNPNEENTVSLKDLFPKGPQNTEPAVSFPILHLQGALEGRYLSCLNLQQSRGLRKEYLHPMTRHLAVPNAALLTNPHTLRPSSCTFLILVQICHY